MLNLDLEAIQREIRTAGHGQKAAIVKRYANLYNVSRDTIYRQLRQEFGKTKTLTREAKIDQTIIDLIACMKERGRAMQLKGRELATETCIRILQDEGVQGSEDLTVSTVNRRLKDSGYRTPDPKVRVEAEYANQEHQLDFSRSKYFQLWQYDPQREDYLLRVSGKELHYKKGDRRLRNWLCQIKDSYSRLRIGKAYAATSEDGFIGLDLLDFTWNRPEDEHPLRYVCDMLKTDNGSFQKRREVKAVLEALAINARRSKAGNHDSQGKIENAFSTIWRKFELERAIKFGEGYMIYLSEYNELLHEFMVADAQEKHPIMNDTREAVYRMSIQSHPPREVDVDILRIACRVDVRDVRDSLMVQYPGGPYQAPAYAAEKKIRVYKNMRGEIMGELMEEDRRPFILTPFEYRAIDDFDHRPAATYRQKMANIAEHQNAEQKAKNKRLFMPPKPKTIEPDSPFIPKDEPAEFASEYAARVYIGNQLQLIGATYADYADVFDGLIAQDLRQSSIDTVLAGVKRTATMRIAL